MTITIIRGAGATALAYKDLEVGRAYRGSDGGLYLALYSFSRQPVVMQLHDPEHPSLDFCLLRDEISMVDFTEVDITITEGAAK